MADSPVFEWACERLEKASTLTRIQARGTLRLVLSGVGLDSRSLGAAQLRVIANRILPKELQKRGVPDVESLCKELAGVPATLEPSAQSAPEDVFERLGRRD
jgi:hypothetical protein